MLELKQCQTLPSPNPTFKVEETKALFYTLSNKTRIKTTIPKGSFIPGRGIKQNINEVHIGQYNLKYF